MRTELRDRPKNGVLPRLRNAVMAPLVAGLMLFGSPGSKSAPAPMKPAVSGKLAGCKKKETTCEVTVRAGDTLFNQVEQIGSQTYLYSFKVLDVDPEGVRFKISSGSLHKSEKSEFRLGYGAHPSVPRLISQPRNIIDVRRTADPKVAHLTFHKTLGYGYSLGGPFSGCSSSPCTIRLKEGSVIVTATYLAVDPALVLAFGSGDWRRIIGIKQSLRIKEITPSGLALEVDATPGGRRTLPYLAAPWAPLKTLVFPGVMSISVNKMDDKGAEITLARGP
ncbi:MAG: hypothetical protein V1827_03110 [Candidatus Micrarchaeota archaeon]